VQRLVPSGSAAVAFRGGRGPAEHGAVAPRRRCPGGALRFARAHAGAKRGGPALSRARRGVLFWTDPSNRPPSPDPLARVLGLEWHDFNSPRPQLGHRAHAGRPRARDLAPRWRCRDGDRDLARASSRPGSRGPQRERRRPGAAARGAVRNRDGAAPPRRKGGRGAGRGPERERGVPLGPDRDGALGRRGIEPAFFGGLAAWLSHSADDRPVRIAAPDLTPAERPIPVRVALPSDGPSRRAIDRRLRAQRHVERPGCPRTAAHGARAARRTSAASGTERDPYGNGAFRGGEIGRRDPHGPVVRAVGEPCGEPPKNAGSMPAPPESPVAVRPQRYTPLRSGPRPAPRPPFRRGGAAPSRFRTAPRAAAPGRRRSR